MTVLDLFDLHGKTALVTGGSSGIGRWVALAYLEAGAQVAIAARNSDALHKVADELAAAGGDSARVVPIVCDVTQPEQVTAMVDRVTTELGGIDIAVCNAGIVSVQAMLDMPFDEFQRVQDTNVTGVFLTAQAAVIALGGATESSMDSTLFEVHERHPRWTSIPYGRPMANQRAYILDSHRQPLPPGVPGELHLARAGLATGYLGQPELTAEKFIDHSFALAAAGALQPLGPATAPATAGMG